MKFSLGLLLVLWLGTGLAAAETSEAILRRVADGVVAQTTRELVDRTTGETFKDSGGLAPKPEISIESKFNAWFYQTWLLADGMRRVADVLTEPRYQNYGEKNLAFIYQHLAYFTRQREAKMRAAPVGDGTLSPIDFHFKLTALWHTGLAPLVIEQSHAIKDGRYGPYLARMDKFLAAAPRFEDGAYFRKNKGMMSDDAYMTVPYLVRRWKQSGDAKELDAAIAQVLGTHRRLFDPPTGLVRHLWSLKTEAPAGEFWGRGNGWMVLAQVELLASIPAAHPRRPEVLAAFVGHMTGIRRFQDPASGGWHQVLNHPESWIETSCTGMFTYGLARGVNEGWLDGSFAPSARKGWAALQAKITGEGDLLDVCGSTDVGDLSYYLKRPRLQGDLHGFGSFLLAGAEILRLESSSGK